MKNNMLVIFYRVVLPIYRMLQIVAVRLRKDLSQSTYPLKAVANSCPPRYIFGSI